MQDIVYKLVPGLQEGKRQNLPLDPCVFSRASKGLFAWGSWLGTSRLARPELPAICSLVSSTLAHVSLCVQGHPVPGTCAALARPRGRSGGASCLCSSEVMPGALVGQV